MIKNEKKGKDQEDILVKTWDSPWGKQRIKKRIFHLTGDMYEVETIGRGEIRRYAVDGIKKVIERNEYEITPEYYKEVVANKKILVEKETEEKCIKDAIKSQKQELEEFLFQDSAMRKGIKIKTLFKDISINGEVGVLKNKIEEMVERGVEINMYQEDKIKAMSRKRYNRATNEEQEEHERRVKAGGKKTVYIVGGYNLGKIAYDYAKHLKAKETVALEK